MRCSLAFREEEIVSHRSSGCVAENRKSRKGKGLNLHNLLANELHSSWKEEDHEIDRRVVSGACKATAIQSSSKKSYHFFHP